MNLDPQDQHSDEDIWQALEHAHLKDFLLDSSQNLEFDCGEGGQNLRYINPKLNPQHKIDFDLYMKCSLRKV